MTAAAKGRPTSKMDNSVEVSQVAIGIKANAVLYCGTIAAIDITGYLVDPTATTGLKAIGVISKAQAGPLVSGAPSQSVTGGTTNGAVSAQVDRGVFKFANSASAPVVQSDLWNACYIEDNQTVARSSSGFTLSFAGTVIQVDDSTSPSGPGVWVAVGLNPTRWDGSAGATGSTG